MIRRTGVVAMIALTTSVGAPAEQLIITRTGTCRDSGSLVASPAEENGSAIVRVAAPPDMPVTVAVTGSDSWRLRLEASGCWSEVRLWSPGADSRIAIQAYPRGALSGRFAGAPEIDEKNAHALLFLRGRGEPSIRAQGSTALECNVDFPRWSCTVPTGAAFDLRWDIPGFAPVHFWDVLIDGAGRKEAPVATLHEGSSVSGWVQDVNGDPAGKAKLTLYPLDATVPQGGKPMSARLRTAKPTARGFFQFTGLAPGTYRLASELDGVSPAVVPEITLRGGEQLEWPRVVRHTALATLTIVLDPPLDSTGSPWTIELAALAPLHMEREAQRKAAYRGEGRWIAEGLRADTWRMKVINGAGSTMRYDTVDLTHGGDMSISVKVDRILVHGTVRYGDEPLETDLRFSNLTGKTVRTSSDRDGKFEATFPSGGKWKPRVTYPAGNGAMVHAEEIEVPDPAESTDAEIDVRLSGGRVRGVVATTTGEKDRAGVSIMRGGRMVAQQATGEDGQFDILGIPAGPYSVTAEGKLGATRAPLDLRLEESEVSELRLILEPYREISGTIRTPDGRPATGATVLVSTDHGRRWPREIADPAGRFTYKAPGGTQEVWIVVLTYSYPATLLRFVTPPADATITLQPQGGILRVEKDNMLTYVSTGGAVASWNLFFFPEPFGRFNGGIYVEPGTYTVCRRASGDSQCRELTVTPNSDTMIRFAGKEKSEAP